MGGGEGGVGWGRWYMRDGGEKKGAIYNTPSRPLSPPPKNLPDQITGVQELPGPGDLSKLSRGKLDDIFICREGWGEGQRVSSEDWSPPILFHPSRNWNKQLWG